LACGITELVWISQIADGYKALFSDFHSAFGGDESARPLAAGPEGSVLIGRVGDRGDCL
jgi:hypothetical protein